MQNNCGKLSDDVRVSTVSDRCTRAVRQRTNIGLDKKMKTRRLLPLNLLGILATLVLVHSSPVSAQQVQVNSTSPNQVAQGTVNLNVTINGKGFAKGAKAQWFVSGTQNPGGVTVNSTAFNSSTQLTANITVASDATVGGYDVAVVVFARTGVGTDTSTITATCVTTGTPAGATLVTTLNSVQPNGAALITTQRLADAIRLRPLDLNHDGTVDTLVAFVASGSSTAPGTYVFFLDPATGQMQANNPVSGAAWPNPLLVMSGVGFNRVAAGDVNGDHIPDFVGTGVGVGNVPYLFVGSVSSAPSYSPSWTAYPINPPAGWVGSWGASSVAMGDVDGIGMDEIAVSAKPKKGVSGVFIFKYSTGALTSVREIQDPTGSDDSFGGAIAIGNIDGKGNDLVVSAPGAGLVFVFPHPVQESNYFTLTGPGPNFGRNLGIADVNLDGFQDLVVITGLIGSTDNTALLYFGTVSAGSTPVQLVSAPGLASGWGDPNIDVADLSASGPGLIAIGAANAGISGCSAKAGVGVLHLFSSPYGSSQSPTLLFEMPSRTISNGFGYGYSVGIVPGYPFILIGAHYLDVGSTSTAGQVYVYKLN